jgi:hypothetical protein
MEEQYTGFLKPTLTRLPPTSGTASGTTTLSATQSCTLSGPLSEPYRISVGAERKSDWKLPLQPWSDGVVRQLSSTSRTAARAKLAKNAKFKLTGFGGTAPSPSLLHLMPQRTQSDSGPVATKAVLLDSTCSAGGPVDRLPRHRPYSAPRLFPVTFRCVVEAPSTASAMDKAD